MPGGGTFRRVRGPRNDWYYHEDDVHAVARAKPGSGRRVRGPLKKQWTTKAGLALSTSFVAELCGTYTQQVLLWGKGRLTREGLKLRRAGKLRVEGCPLWGWRADDAVAIARTRGRGIPPDLDEAYPPNGNGHASHAPDQSASRDGKAPLVAVTGPTDIRNAGKGEAAEDGASVGKDLQAANLKKNHPDWSDRRIAKRIGCNVSTLSRSKLYQQAKALFSADKTRVRRGWQLDSGDVESATYDPPVE